MDLCSLERRFKRGRGYRVLTRVGVTFISTVFQPNIDPSRLSQSPPRLQLHLGLTKADTRPAPKRGLPSRPAAPKENDIRDTRTSSRSRVFGSRLLEHKEESRDV